MTVCTAVNMRKNRSALDRYLLGATLFLATVGLAHAADAAQASTPHYVTIVRQIDVNKPAATVWSKVGGFCDLTKWLGKSCEIVAGSGNEIGATRKIDHQIIEVLVGKTATSYTYSQPEMPGAQVHFYHGTLDVQPVTAKTSRIVYTLFYDNASIGDTAAQKKEYDGRTAVFQKAVETMKGLAEGTVK
jgi:NADPH-dependent 2,4-dienoyl-CoA reductase/sulfur reductase-like enzyme